MERSKYLILAWCDHLSDHNTYKHMSEQEAHQKIATIINGITFFIHKFRPSLQQDKMKYLPWLLDRVTYINTFWPACYMYLLAKIHNSPLKTQAIISYSSSLCHGLAKWIHKELKKIINKLDYIATDSTYVVQELTQQKWHRKSLLFTCNATSMYTNTHLGHALQPTRRLSQHHLQNV